jgi:hypothetical protein
MRAWLYALPLAAAALTARWTVIPNYHDDVHARVERIAKITEPEARLLVAEPDFNYMVKLIRLRLQMLGHNGGTYLATFEFPSEVQSGKAEAECRADVRGRIAAGKPVWLIEGAPLDASASHVRAFLRWLASEYRLEAPDGAPEGVRRVLSK